MKDYRKMRVWEKAHQVTLRVYKITESFPKSEIYGLTSQVRRAASSVPANIAEGCGKQSEGEFGRYIDIASGSASELDYLLLLGKDLQYVGEAEYDKLSQDVVEVRKMLTSLWKKVKRGVISG